MSQATLAARTVDLSRFRAMLFELSREHHRIPLPLVDAGACGSALAIKPMSLQLRREASEAWQRLMLAIGRNLESHADEQLADRAVDLGMVSPSLRETIGHVCDHLSELARQISALDLEGASDDSAAKAGESMRMFATALDDLAVLEEHELLPKMRKFLSGHVDTRK
jgi:hypothetical protein